MALAVNSIAQEEEYADLLNMLIDENYEKLLYKAEKYMEGDDTKRDPLPYLYSSMSYFEISKISDFDDVYPKAFKNALKYASKYKKKDKESQYYDDNVEFFDELRKVAMVEAENFNDMEKYSKSKGYYKYLYLIDDKDAGAWLYSGLTLEKLKSAKEAEVALAKSKELIEGGCDNLSDTQLNYLRTGLLYMADIYSADGRGSEAKEWMELVMSFFEVDKEFKVTYNNL